MPEIPHYLTALNAHSHPCLVSLLFIPSLYSTFFNSKNFLFTCILSTTVLSDMYQVSPPCIAWFANLRSEEVVTGKSTVVSISWTGSLDWTTGQTFDLMRMHIEGILHVLFVAHAR